MDPTYTLTISDGSDVRVLAAGTARCCLVAAARHLSSLDLDDVRCEVLPRIQRQIAAGERPAFAVVPEDDDVFLAVVRGEG
jgi:hypothetical protein